MSLKEKALAGLTSIPDPDHGYGRYQVPDELLNFLAQLQLPKIIPTMLVPEPPKQRDTARWSA